MAVCNLSDLISLMPPRQCLLGIDYGRVVIGIAISDPDLSVASPLLALKKGKFMQDAAFLSQIIRERQVGGIVLGLPKNMDGTEGPLAQAVRSFASNLLKKAELPVPDMPIAFWDERLSTAAVTRAMLEDDMSRQKRLSRVDKAAAAYILQGALDSLRG